jgi:hypothetical protein
MRTPSVLTMLVTTALAITFCLSEVRADPPLPPGLPAPPRVEVHVNGYLPAPPGVHVRIDGGRPYYVERDRRIYLEREQPVKHHKKKKKRHVDQGNKYGHDKQKRHDN